MPSFDPYSFVSRRVHSVGFTREMFETMVSFIMDDVERLFGQRLEHPFGGIYFASSHPRVEWRIEKGKEVSKIRLSAGTTRSSAGWTLIQLTHECVHLLHPPKVRSSVLEEGLATWYQKRWVEKCPELFPTWAKAPDRYREGYWCAYDDALTLVEQLLETDQDIIKRLRDVEPSLSKVTSRMILKASPGLDKLVAGNLAKKFKRGKPRKKV